jgi:hypothetical protein
MPLTPPAARERLHLRGVSYEGFRRADGLFDIEAHITDHKDRDYQLAMGTRSKDVPVHNMWARVTIDRRFDVLDIEAVTDEMPYRGQCDRIGPEYKKLIGSNLLKGFRKSIAENMGGVKGCTHLSELLGYLPTAAVQTFAGIKNEADAVDGRKPFQLDSCHALASNTDTVRVYYPKWFVGENAGIRDEVAAL